MADEQDWENGPVAAGDAVGEFLAETALPQSPRHNARVGGNSTSAADNLPERPPSLDAQWNLEFVSYDAASADEFVSETQLRQWWRFAAAGSLPNQRAIQVGLAASALLGIALIGPRGAPDAVRAPQRAAATTEATAPSLLTGAAIPELLRAEAPSTTTPAGPQASGPAVAVSGRTTEPMRLSTGDGVPLNRDRARATIGSRAATPAAVLLDSRTDQQQASATATSSNGVTERTDAGQETERSSPNQPRVSSGEGVSATAAMTVPVGPGIRAAVPEPAPPADESGDARGLPSAPPATSERNLPVLDTEPVRDLLAGYRTAYERLDARLAKRVWPAVDERALARAFDALESQSVTFETCSVSVGEQRAIASCRGSATYVTRMGRRRSHTEPRQWTFQLEKSPQRWVIGGVDVR